MVTDEAHLGVHRDIFVNPLYQTRQGIDSSGGVRNNHVVGVLTLTARLLPRILNARDFGLDRDRTFRRRWRDYRTVGGNRPVKEFLDTLSDEDAAEVAQAMKEVTLEGLVAARHLRGDVYEVRADGNRKSFRILFAAEGRFSQVLLALEGFQKRTQQTPPAKIRLAERRLADWRQRGQSSSE